MRFMIFGIFLKWGTERNFMCFVGWGWIVELSYYLIYENVLSGAKECG